MKIISLFMVVCLLGCAPPEKTPNTSFIIEGVVTNVEGTSSYSVEAADGTMYHFVHLSPNFSQWKGEHVRIVVDQYGNDEKVIHIQ